MLVQDDERPATPCASNWISLGDAAAMVMKRLLGARLQWVRR
jgi:hypothetical protein